MRSRSLFLCGVLLASSCATLSASSRGAALTAQAEADFQAERWGAALTSFDAAHQAGEVLTVPHRLMAARAAASSGREDDAFRWLERAFAGGAPAELLKQRPAFAELAKDPRWDALVQQYDKPCDRPAFHELDFWLGRWAVTTVQGVVAGTNVITQDVGGCRVVEHWTGASGGGGSSINWYDPSTQRWNQLWIDEQGSLIHYVGQRVGDVMQLEGVKVLPDGTRLASRMRLIVEGAKVHQIIELSSDGTTWQAWFDALYEKAAAP